MIGLVIFSFLVGDVPHSNAGAWICHASMSVARGIRWRLHLWFFSENVRFASVITGGDEGNTILSPFQRLGLCLWRHWVLLIWRTAVSRCILSWQRAQMGLSGACDPFYALLPPKIRRVQRVILVSGLFAMRISFTSFFPCLKFDPMYYSLV